MKLKSEYNSGDAKFKAGVEISINSAFDNYFEKTVSVYISLKSDTVDAVRGLGEFSYTETWEDADVLDFIKTKIDIE